MSREAPRFVALEPVSFSITAAYSSFSLSGGAIKFAWSGALYHHKHGLGSP